MRLIDADVAKLYVNKEAEKILEGLPTFIPVIYSRWDYNQKENTYSQNLGQFEPKNRSLED